MAFCLRIPLDSWKRLGGGIRVSSQGPCGPEAAGRDENERNVFPYFRSPRPGKTRLCLWLFLSVTGLDLMPRPHISCPVRTSECWLEFTSPTSALSSALWTQTATSLPPHTSFSVVRPGRDLMSEHFLILPAWQNSRKGRPWLVLLHFSP